MNMDAIKRFLAKRLGKETRQKIDKELLVKKGIIRY